MFVWPAGRPSVLRAKSLTLYITHKLLNQLFFIPATLEATLTSTILYYFLWPWLCQGVTRLAQSKTYLLHISHTFHLITMKINVMRWLSWTAWNYFWASFIETKEITVVSQTTLKKRKPLTLACIRTYLIHTWYGERYYCTLHFDTGLTDLDQDWRSHKCTKAKTSAPIISQSFKSIWIVYCENVLAWWASYSFYFVHSVFMGENHMHAILL